MSEIEQTELRHIKICLLGSEKVGKTYLVHKLVEKDYENYGEAHQCQQFTKELSDKKEVLIYYDFPSIDSKMADEFTKGHIFDMMICLFKDSTSFGQLYEFFQSISKKTEENDPIFNNYWSSITNFILVYSDFDQKQQVQLEQLFNILLEQIRNFNRTASVKQFVLKHGLSNHQYLRYLIEKNRFQEHFSPLKPQSNSMSHEEMTLVITELPSNLNQKSQILESSKNFRENENGDDDELPDLVEIKLTSTKQKAIDSQGQIEEENHTKTLGKKVRFKDIEIDEEEQYKVTKDYATSKQEGSITDHRQSKEMVLQNVSKQSQQTKTFEEQTNSDPKIQAHKTLQQTANELYEKEQEHYRDVFEKLMQKISNEQIEASKKTSYKDLFQEFRKTSKHQSKISKELRDYWHKKIEKLEAEEDQEDDQQNDKSPPRPTSTRKQNGAPKRENSTAQADPCFCKIM